MSIPYTVEYIKEKYKHYLYIELMPEERKKRRLLRKTWFSDHAGRRADVPCELRKQNLKLQDRGRRFPAPVLERRSPWLFQQRKFLQRPKHSARR